MLISFILLLTSIHWIIFTNWFLFDIILWQTYRSGFLAELHSSFQLYQCQIWCFWKLFDFDEVNTLSYLDEKNQGTCFSVESKGWMKIFEIAKASFVFKSLIPLFMFGLLVIPMNTSMFEEIFTSLLIWIGSPYLASLIPLLHKFCELSIKSKWQFLIRENWGRLHTITKTVSCC